MHSCYLPLYRYEKLVGGLYQAEIVRQILYELTNLGQIFGGIWPEKLQDYKSLHPSFLCIIERDPPYLFYTTEFLLKEHYDIENLTAEDVYIVRYVCKAVVYRAACLTASGRCLLIKYISFFHHFYDFAEKHNAGKDYMSQFHTIN